MTTASSEARTRPAPGAPSAVRPLAVGDLVLDAANRVAYRGGAEIRLTATECALLRQLMSNPGRVLSKALLLDRVWAPAFGPGDRGNLVELYISYLRKKIDAGRPPMIHTRRGMGYVLKPAA
ncbi:winged helix-turn-helix transcriptional regulator [Streptomyces sp. AV19]|uniref:winged helix-turn-helix domain-containing protein n=1 Tax=Streptomyces sp. AV19 TaxID=2793068 RepID=UPI0018FE7730|nr:winged helix-turn-helix transcriptional regulator [Streptomyces sp. AV19]